jgi:mannan endo-1,4-beta-mannosidase
VQCTPCKESFYSHIKFILKRKNRYNNQNYNDDATIMSWQVANEPRIMGSISNEDYYSSWLSETTFLIRSLSKNQLISTGAEGKASYFNNIEVFEHLHNSQSIDYLTMHMWPKNWSWYDPNNESKSTLNSIEKGLKYMNEHIEISNKLNKPIVMSEFGFPREKESLSKNSSVKNRNLFFQEIIEQVVISKKDDGSLAGLNFWGFGGIAKNNPNKIYWSLGDDFTADPPQEPQGLNTVFARDKSTLELIKKGNELLIK